MNDASYPAASHFPDSEPGRWSFSLISSFPMDVFVIPLAGRRYELYCEPPSGVDLSDTGPPPSGLIARLRYRFTVMLRAAEERRLHGHAADESKGWMGRLQDRMMAWVVERIAEQRLLWNLRGQTVATVAYPQDMTFEEALGVVRSGLQRDHNRHQRWMVVDGIAFVLTFVFLGPLFLLVPGVANLPALYFGFRVIGHWLSMRGSSHGLHRVSWDGRPCPPLGELRDLAALGPAARVERLHDIAARLRLHHLATFVERVSARHA